MMNFRDCWQDGQAGVSWFAGLHEADWVEHFPDNENRDKDELELKMLDTEKVLNLAAERLETIIWFGLLERLEESLFTFNTQIKGTKPVSSKTKTSINSFQLIMEGKLNEAKPGMITNNLRNEISDETRSKLEWLMPYDIWLYDYASILFDARLAHLKTGEPYKEPKRPELPKVTCLSTRYILTCDTGPFGPAFYHQAETIPPKHLQKFSFLKEKFVRKSRSINLFI